MWVGNFVYGDGYIIEMAGISQHVESAKPEFVTTDATDGSFFGLLLK